MLIIKKITLLIFLSAIVFVGKAQLKSGDYTDAPIFQTIKNGNSFGNFSYKINKITYIKDIELYDERTTANQTFIVINLTIKNIDSLKHLGKDASFVLIDEQKQQFVISDFGQVVFDASPQGLKVEPEYEANQEQNVNLVFDAPMKKSYSLKIAVITLDSSSWKKVGGDFYYNWYNKDVLLSFDPNNITITDTKNIESKPRLSSAIRRINEMPQSLQKESEYQAQTFMGNWMGFLERNINNSEEVDGTVDVSFSISKEGNPIDIKAESGPAQLYNAAIKVIKRSEGMWFPALSGGKYVKNKIMQPITYSGNF